jgi:hypothetical protein
LEVLAEARAALVRAAEWRAGDCPRNAALSLNAARAMLADARKSMADAPASTRRRWRNQDATNTRKRYARAGFPRNGAYASLAHKA